MKFRAKDYSHYLHGDEVDRDTRAVGKILGNVQDPNAKVINEGKVHL